MRALPLILFLAACGGTATTDTDLSADTDTDETTSDATGCEGVTPKVTDLSLAELDAMLAAKDFDLINVHIPVNGQIAGTDADIAYTDPDGLEDWLDHDLSRKVVLYCMTGPMSTIATQDLVDRGYCNVYDLPDGMAQWDAAGYPMQ